MTNRSGMYLVLGPMGGQTPGCRLCGMPVTAHRSKCPRHPGVLKTLRQKLDAERAVDASEVATSVTHVGGYEIPTGWKVATEEYSGTPDRAREWGNGAWVVWTWGGNWWALEKRSTARRKTFATAREAFEFAETAMAPKADEPLEGWAWHDAWGDGSTVWRKSDWYVRYYADAWRVSTLDRKWGGCPGFPTMHEAMRYAESHMAPVEDAKPEAEGVDREGWTAVADNDDATRYVHARGCVEPSHAAPGKWFFCIGTGGPTNTGDLPTLLAAQKRVEARA